MKKIISFEKELDFPSMIGEVTSISLDHTIKFDSKSSAIGKFIVSGTYKMTEASTLNEDFTYDIPVEITLTEVLDLESSKISINNFNYEIINDDILKCNIDLMIEGVEEVILQEVEEEKEILKEDSLVRECDGDIHKNNIEDGVEEMIPEIIENEIKIPEAEVKENIQNNKETIMEEKTTNMSSLFQVFENSEETFTTYSVYIMRKNDSLENVMQIYNITRDELSEYNDLENIEIGSKLIIPNIDE